MQQELILAAKSNLSSLEAQVDKTDVDKLKTGPADLSKLRNVVNNEAVRKTVYDKLVTEVNKIDTRGLVLKNKYASDKSNLEKKISDADKKLLDISGLVKTKNIWYKIAKIDSKIPSFSGLATNYTLTAVENRIPDVSSLVKKQIMIQKYQTLKR